VDDQLFGRFCEIAYAKAGIKLGAGKEVLVGARVSKRIRALRLAGPGEYLAVLEADTTGAELVSFLDAISTNFTAFFREPTHFQRLDEFLHHRLRSGVERLRIWSAAASSGEEPYTIAMTVAEAVGNASVDWRVLATDISTKILGTAERGVYGEQTLKEVPRLLLSRYFAPLDSKPASERQYQVKEDLRRRVVFKRLNLAKVPYPMRGPLDVVFCRNVMIYFDDAIRQGVLSEIDRLLAVDGLVFVGHSESLVGLQTNLSVVEPSVYRPRNSGVPLAKSKCAWNRRE
jgi:chemotaxis protein methyltransferase CheR